MCIYVIKERQNVLCDDVVDIQLEYTNEQDQLNKPSSDNRQHIHLQRGQLAVVKVK